MAFYNAFAYTNNMQKTWKDVGSLYQIYPRSFQDTNGDGVGDLNGITDRLGYLSWLGVESIWISPFFTSPMTDFGYDVSNYRDVDPSYGTLEDFKRLLTVAHGYGIKIMIDLVPCHTSEEHPWFLESRSSKDNPKRDYYVWRDPKDDGSAPNNWRSLAAGRSWTFDETTGQYYLHSFLPTQPDLNWDNPEVREEMKNIVRFWYDMGVDGLRVDAIWGISKDPDLADDPINPDYHHDMEQYGSYIHNKCKYGPNFDKYLHELASINDEYEDRQIVFEFYPDEQLGDIYGQYERVLNIHPKASAFFMEYRQNNWHADHVKYTIEQYLNRTRGQAIPFFGVGNHDQPRIQSRLGEGRARALNFLNLLTPGISLVYYGDEIGMVNGDLSNDQIQDTFSPSNTKFDSRDLERTPMQWDSSEFAGFSEAKPWLPVHQNRDSINVLAQTGDESSLLYMTRCLLKLRTAIPALRHGDLEFIDVNNGYVMAFRRSLGDDRFYVVVNFADQPQHYKLPEDCETVLTSDVKMESQPGLIDGHQAILLRAVS